VDAEVSSALWQVEAAFVAWTPRGADDGGLLAGVGGPGGAEPRGGDRLVDEVLDGTGADGLDRVDGRRPGGGGLFGRRKPLREPEGAAGRRRRRA